MNIDERIIDVLQRSTFTGREIRIPFQLERKLYVEVDRVLTSLGGRWNRKSKSHMFDRDACDVVRPVLSTGVYVDKKKEFQFFETPKNLARALVDLADLRDGHRVLEPSAGRGAIAVAILEKHIPELELELCEIEESNRQELQRQGFKVIHDDFLTLSQSARYDRIIANPPFSKHQDIRHVTRMFEFLKPGGLLVSVMSPGFTFHEDSKCQTFKTFIAHVSGEVIELGSGTFKESGTMVNSRIVVLKKGFEYYGELWESRAI